MTDESKVFTVMLEPVKNCNLCCRYCYSDNESSAVMSVEVLDLVIKKIIAYIARNDFREIHFIWHGGEPLLAGIDFFKHAVRIIGQHRANVNSRHFIQTNGLLLDDEFCSFFQDSGFELGISLDGPADLHDRFRKTETKAGTHAAVMKKVRMLEKRRIPMGFCSVVSRASIGHEDRIYRFFQEMGYRFRINPLIPAIDFRKTNPYLFHQGEYGKLLCRFFDQMIRPSPRRVMVSPLDIYLHAIIEGDSAECQHQLSCIGTHLGVRSNGEAVLCSRFNTHVLGDLKEISIEEIFASSLCLQIQQRSHALNSCRLCFFQSICHGGCPHNCIVFGRNLTEKDPFCKDYQIIFDYIRNTIEFSR